MAVRALPGPGAARLCSPLLRLFCQALETKIAQLLSSTQPLKVYVFLIYLTAAFQKHYLSPEVRSDVVAFDLQLQTEFGSFPSLSLPLLSLCR